MIPPCLRRRGSWVMIVVFGAMMLMVWRIASRELAPEFGSGMVAGLMIAMVAFTPAPLLLYLYLFRKSKYP